MFGLYLLIGISEWIKEKATPINKTVPEAEKLYPDIADIIDSEGYKYDYNKYGKQFAEEMRRIGKYNRIRRNFYERNIK